MDDPHVIPVTDPEGLPQFLDAVNQAAAQADDILLLYYVGHGLVNLAGEFFLATSATTDRDVMLPAEALPFAAIRGALSVSRARHVVVVPDCCFSGRAPGEFATAVADAFELTNLQGSYLLTATSATEQACFGPLASRRRERYPECMHALTAVATAVGPSGSESAPEERLRAALEAAGVRQLRRRAGRRPRVAPN
jgi:hypothetical protein